MKRALFVLITAMLSSATVTATAQATVGNPDNVAFVAPKLIFKGFPVTTGAIFDRIGLLQAHNHSGRNLLKLADASFYTFAVTAAAQFTVVTMERIAPAILRTAYGYIPFNSRWAGAFTAEKFAASTGFAALGAGLTLTAFFKHYAFPDAHAATIADQYLSPSGYAAFLDLAPEEQARMISIQPKLATLTMVLGTAAEESEAQAQN